MEGALLTASTTFVVAILAFYLAKARERETNWRNLKLEFYREFVLALAATAKGDATNEDLLRFNRATNALPLIASSNVLNALELFRREISVSNLNRSIEEENKLRTKLFWEIRRDIGYIPAGSDKEFAAHFWNAGISVKN